MTNSSTILAMNINQNKKILLIDDDVEILNLLSKYLSLKSYKIFTASSGRRGLEMAHNYLPDLIILDIKMPEMDGFEVSQKLKENEKLSYLPVIFLSSHDEEENRMKAFSVDGVDFLRKPVSKEEILKKVNKYLNEYQKWQKLNKEKRLKEKLSYKESKKQHLSESRTYKKKITSFYNFLIEKLKLKPEIEKKFSRVSFLNIFKELEKLDIDNEKTAQFLAEFNELEYLANIESASIILGLLPYSFCKTNLVIPVKENDSPAFIISNPLDLSLIDSLQKIIGWKEHLNLKVSNPDSIRRFFESVQNLEIYYPSLKEKNDPSKTEIHSEKDGINNVRKINLISSQDVYFMSDDKLSAFVNLTNQILTAAINQRASDIHIEPKEDKAYVRFRVDGNMRDAFFIHPETCKGLISRLKVLAHMNITETRRPQDGAIEALLDKEKIKMRLATVGTPYGESMIIRIFDPSISIISISELGMNKIQTELMKEIISYNKGLILVVGPTGSGKTTTVYSLLNSIDTKSRSLASIEDPVEYSIPYANQQEVNDKIGITFESLLKSAVRQDPDILFIGEIRDKYSARFAVEAASTGHLTFSTLHTTNATTAIFRLERFDISRAALAEAILAIIAQRLVRTLCPHCKEIREITKKDKDLLANFTHNLPSHVGYPTGCSRCNHTGYLGRSGVYEILSFDSYLTNLIQSGIPISDIRSNLSKKNVKFFFHHALEKIRQNTISVSEAYSKVLSEEYSSHDSSRKEAHPSQEGDSLPLSPLGKDRKRILIVEDDEHMKNFICLFLKDQNYEVFSAQDGIEALLQLGKINFDLILSDINMPNLNGLKLLEMVAQKGINTPIIFITSRTAKEDEIRGLSLGAVDYIKKPISKEILLFRIERILKNMASK